MKREYVKVEKKIKMRSVSGKIDSFPESEVEHRKFYGWKVVKEKSKKSKGKKSESEVKDV